VAKAFIGLGSNLGDRVSNIAQALARLGGIAIPRASAKTF